MRKNAFSIRTLYKYWFLETSGFTLIELLIVFSIIAILSTVGIATFVDYSRTQAMRVSVSDFASLLIVARSRSLAQIKPPACGNQTLEGYQVVICKEGSACSTSTASYELQGICSGNIYVLQTKTLPPNLSFADNLGSVFLFPLLKSAIVGASTTGTTVTFSGYGKTGTVTLYEDGRVVQN